MKKKLCMILSAALMLTLLAGGCSSGSNEPSSTPEASPQGTEQAVVPTAEPVQSAEPADTPRMALADYPKVDGSTATLPLGINLMKLVTGVSDAEAEENTVFSMTDPSYEAMSRGEADMLVVYEAADATKEQSWYSSFDIRPVGRDALVFIVNEDNPVNSLTTEQIVDIYTGKITNWKEVGGNDAEIVAFQRPLASGSQTMIRKLVMKDKEMVEAPSELVAQGMDDIINAISAYDSSANAIGYSVYYYAKNMYAQPGLKFISVDGVFPDTDTIRKAEYPHINDFFVILPENPKENAVVLRDWLLTDQGQDFLLECGYVPVK